MNNLQRYVNYVQPVIKVIREQHNEYLVLNYFSVSAEDIFAEGGYIEFGTKGDLTMDLGDLKGVIPMIYANTQEENGGHLVIEIAPEHRKLLSPEVLDVIKTEDLEYINKWNNTADQTLYLRMDHGGISERDFTGFYPSDEFEDTVSVGFALDFISHQLGLGYLRIHDGDNDLESILDCEE